MRRAGVTHENRLLLHNVIPLTVCLTWIDSMLKIEAAAGRIAFDDLVAHDEVFLEVGVISGRLFLGILDGPEMKERWSRVYLPEMPRDNISCEKKNSIAAAMQETGLDQVGGFGLEFRPAEFH